MSARPLDVRFREQAEQCREAGSPLTAALLEGAADELGRPGPVADLLGPLADDPAGTVPSLRLAAALHRLVLERRAPRLALHYPSVGGTAPVEGVWEVAREVLLGDPDVPELLRHPVQTNEVGRAAVLYGGLLHVTAGDGLPVRLLEVGASAGLLLQVDRYAYEVGDRVLGDPTSPLRLVQPWQGAAPRDADLRLASRAGCDPAPLDPTSTADRLTLTSCVWPDQVDRLERLRAALEVAARDPVRGGAAAGVGVPGAGAGRARPRRRDRRLAQPGVAVPPAAGAGRRHGRARPCRAARPAGRAAAPPVAGAHSRRPVPRRADVLAGRRQPAARRRAGARPARRLVLTP